MHFLARRLAVAVLLGGFAVLGTVSGTAADDKPDASDIMKKCNGKKGCVATIKTASKDMKWEDVQKAAKTLKEQTAALAKADPHMGEKDSWAKMTKGYAEKGAAVAEAAEKKDAKALETALKAYGGTCKACHDAHK